MIYFIRSEANGLIKIGYALSPKLRFRQLTFMSPVPIQMIGFIPGGKGEERKIHDRFRNLRHHGEWFRPSDDLISFIESRRDSHESDEAINLDGEGPTAEKRRSVVRLLSDPEWRMWSNRHIARQCGVSDAMVAKYRKSLGVEETSENHPRFVTRNGKSYSQKTRKIGLKTKTER